MKKKVLFIVGPTSCGKTALSLRLSDRYPVEIISADSRQIYRFMNIGTAKPEKTILEQYKHHFIDMINPDEYYSAGRFGKEARETVDDIFERGKIPVVAGGSGFYIKVLIDGIFEEDTKDEELRKTLEQRMRTEGADRLYRELYEKDAQYAAKISANDRQRILRGLEVIYLTGKTFSEWRQQPGETLPYDPVMIGLDMERADLYKRINKRVDGMLETGLIDEVKFLLEKGYSLQNNALNTVGYKEVINYLNDETARAEMVELIKRNTRRYAKRQTTWFRGDKRIQWKRIAGASQADDLAKEIAAAVFPELI